MARSTDQPPLKWPIIAVVATGWTVISNVTDFTVGKDSADDATAALVMFPFVVLMLAASIAWYYRRVAARKRWRDERELEWWTQKRLTPPPYTDWEAFEREITDRVLDPTKQNGRVER